MDRAVGNIAALSGAVSPALATHRQRHLSFQNDVSGFDGVRMVGISAVGAVLPHIRAVKTFAMQFVFKFANVHRLRTRDLDAAFTLS